MDSDDDVSEVLLLYLLHRRQKQKAETEERSVRRWMTVGQRWMTRSVWVDPTIRTHSTEGFFCTLWPQLKEDKDKFFEFTGMTRETFQELLDITRKELRRQNTNMRNSIPPEERLAFFLRYFVSDRSLKEVSEEFRVGGSTASSLMRMVCRGILKVVGPAELPDFSDRRWLDAAAGFEARADIPRCVGAVGGRHVPLLRVDRDALIGPNVHCDRRGRCSLVLLAVADATGLFTHVEVVPKGEEDSDFMNSTLHARLRAGTAAFPESCAESGNASAPSLPYVLVGDGACPQSEVILRPFLGKTYNDDRKRAFNFRLGRAMKCVDEAFGLLAGRWKIFTRPLNMSPELAEDLVRTACVLHNFVRRREGEDHRIQPHMLANIAPDPIARPNRKAYSVRELFTDYFVNVAPLPDQFER